MGGGNLLLSVNRLGKFLQRWINFPFSYIFLFDSKKCINSAKALNDHILCRFPEKRQSSLPAAAVFQNPGFEESNPSHHSAEACDHQQVALRTEIHKHCKN